MRIRKWLLVFCLIQGAALSLAGALRSWVAFAEQVGDVNGGLQVGLGLVLLVCAINLSDGITAHGV